MLRHLRERLRRRGIIIRVDHASRDDHPVQPVSNDGEAEESDASEGKVEVNQSPITHQTASQLPLPIPSTYFQHSKEPTDELKVTEYVVGDSSLPIPPEPIPPDEIIEALDYFADIRRAFTLEEFAEWLGEGVQLDRLRQFFTEDTRFIWLTQEDDKDYVIPEESLFRWWADLNLRLARAKVFRLTARQLAHALSSLRVGGKWASVPLNAFEYGSTYGLVTHAWNAGYVFPLAGVFSELGPCLVEIVIQPLLKQLCERDNRETLLRLPLDAWLQKGFSRFKDRTVRVVLAREGLRDGNKMTLEQIGSEWRVTRERIRQIEANFYKALRDATTKYAETWPQEEYWARMKSVGRLKRLAPFLVGFVCHMISNGGRLVIQVDSEVDDVRVTRLFRLLGKCTGLPETKLGGGQLVIVGLELDAILKTIGKLSTSVDKPIDVDSIATKLDSIDGIYLPGDDIPLVSSALVKKAQGPLNKMQRVYLALKAIGSPSHFTNITSVYNSMFPDDESSEHTIEATLGRAKNSIVYLGAKGIYALKEWGYERPSVGYFDAVTEIVVKKYKETGRPVPFTVIVGEIGKYRQIVNQTSLVFASSLNDKLKRVGKDTFLPRDDEEDIQGKITSYDLDRALQEVEKLVEASDYERIEECQGAEARVRGPRTLVCGAFSTS